MELNTGFYTNPQDDLTHCTQFNTFTDLPVNLEFDISGAYGMTDGGFAPWCNIGVAHGGDYSIFGDLHYNMTDLNTTHTFHNLPMFLTLGAGIATNVGYNDGNLFIPNTNFNDLTNGHDISSYATGYNSQYYYHWAPNAPNNTVSVLDLTYREHME